MIFGLFKKSPAPPPQPQNPPPLTTEMIQPVGQPLSLTDAKAVFRAYTLRVGVLDKDEVALHVGHMVDEIKSHEEALKEDAQQFKEAIREAASEVKDAKRELSKAKSEQEKADAQSDLDEAEFNLQAATQDFEEAAKALADFKADKREFVIKYVNQQFQRDE
jgi:hypothetical protein